MLFNNNNKRKMSIGKNEPMKAALLSASLMFTGVVSALEVIPGQPVIIGGAGIAGIAAAHELDKKGIPFIILEARDRVGGRMNKFTFGQDGKELTLERGANWIQGTVRNPIWDLKKKYHLKGERQNWGNYTVYDGKGQLVEQAYNGTHDPEGALADEAWLESVTLGTKCLQPASSEEQTPADINYCKEKLGDDYVASNSPAHHMMSNDDAQLIATGFEAKTALERVYEYWSQDFEYAEHPKLSSAKANLPLYSYTDFKDADFFVFDKRGYQWLVESLGAEFLLTDKSQTNTNKITFDTQNPASRLKYNRKVTKVTYDNDVSDGHNSGVIIETCVTRTVEQGATFNNEHECVLPYQLETFTGSYFIPTFSVGVLQQSNKDDVAGLTGDARKDSSPEFIPAFPADMKAGINNYSMAIYSKIFFKFPFKFWDDSSMIISAFGPEGLSEEEKGEYAPIWQSMDMPNKSTWAPESNALFVTVTGERAIRFQTMSIAAGKLAAKTEMLAVLNKLYPESISELCQATAGACNNGTQLTLADIVDFSMTPWLKNPLFRGAYSNWSTGRTDADQEAFRAARGNLLISGEAICSRYNGYTHGGMLAGMRTARNLLKFELGFDDVNTESTCDVAPDAGNNPNAEGHIVKARGKGGLRLLE